VTPAGVTPLRGARGDRADIVFGAVLAIAGLVIARSAAALPTIPSQAYGPGFFPMWVGIALAVCGVLMVGRILMGRRIPPAVTELPAAPPEGVGLSPRAVLAVAWLIIGLVLVAWLLETVGFLLCMPVFMLGFLWLVGEPLRRSVSTTAVAMAVVYWGFAKLLKVPLPLGWLQGLF
jgi:putative tricarboxylic transport membrane protein